MQVHSIYEKKAYNKYVEIPSLTCVGWHLS